MSTAPRSPGRSRALACGLLLSLLAPCAARSAEAVVAASSRPASAGETSAKLFRDTAKKVLIFGKFEIRGSAGFAAKTRDALILLEDSTTFAKLSPYIAAIEESTRSGITAWTEKPASRVGSGTWSGDTAWYAGALAHDGCHSRLYHAARKAAGKGRVPDSAWTGTKPEQECLAAQAQVLTELKAYKYFTDYVRGLMKDPAYQDLSYSSRTW